MAAIPPATLEGWYTLHQVFNTDWRALRHLDAGARREMAAEVGEMFRSLAAPDEGGWSAAFRLAGGSGDWLFVHFRPALEQLSDVELRLRRTALGAHLNLEYDYLSVTEAGLYHATAEAAREAEPRSKEFDALLAERADEERRTAHIQTRLYPEVPGDMRYISFYPMNKKRVTGQNWYTLDVEERNRLMREHGLTGRRFARRVFQVIGGSIGLDDWEWAVTLFARDPLEFKKIVTEMRFDEASSVYGEFGSFFTGVRIEPDEWPALLGAGDAAPRGGVAS